MEYHTTTLAREVGIHPNTVRLYESLGFLGPVPRAANGYRVYDERHRAQLRVCRRIYECGWLGREIRAASLAVICAMAAWRLDDARARAQEYRRLIVQEQAVAAETAEILRRWAEGAASPACGAAYGMREAAARIGVTPEALRNWERNGLLTVPRAGPNRARVYHQEQIERLRVIYMLRQSRYSLSAILRSMRELDEGRAAGVIAALDQPDLQEDRSYICQSDRWLSALADGARGAEDVLALIEEAEHQDPQPSTCAPPFALHATLGHHATEGEEK